MRVIPPSVEAYRPSQLSRAIDLFTFDSRPLSLLYGHKVVYPTSAVYGRLRFCDTNPFWVVNCTFGKADERFGHQWQTGRPEHASLVVPTVSDVTLPYDMLHFVPCYLADALIRIALIGSRGILRSEA